MRIKYFLITAVLATAVLCSASAVKAVTIEELIAQIAQLQAQLVQLQAQQGTTTTWCHTFTANIGVGVKKGNPELDALVIALQKEGLLEQGATFPEGYDEILASAVTGFQEKYASEILTPYNLAHGTGYVGTKTRAKLNALYGCGETSAPSIAISPTNLVRGGTYNFNGKLKNATPNSQIKFYLRSPDGAMQENGRYVGTTDSAGKFFLETTQTIYGGAQSGIYIGWVIVGDKKSNEVSFVVFLSSTSCTDSDNGKDYFTKGTAVDKYGTYTDLCYAATGKIFEYYCDSNLGYSQGAYYTCPNGCENGACKPSTTQPSITVTSPNGGETLTTGQTYTIRWNSSNILSSQNVKIELAYTHTDPTYKAGNRFEDWIVEKTPNTGSYSWTVSEFYGLGLKESSFSVKISSESGAIDYSDANFTIKMGTSNPALTIAPGPIAGAIYKAGDQITISWTPFDGTSSYGLTLLKKSDPSFIRWATLYPVYNSTVSGVPQSYYWNVLSGLSGNDYYLRVDTSRTASRTNIGYSAVFTITDTSTQPSITVTSPNGGETWKIGETHYINFQSSGVNKVNIIAKNITDGSSYSVAEDVDVSNSHTHAWVVGFNHGGFTMTPGQYKIEVSNDASSGGLDTSDNSFTIALAQLLTTSSATIIGNQNTYTAGQTIKFSVKGVISDGSSGVPEKGFNVQYHLRDSIDTVKINGVYQAGNASYNYSTGYWDITATAPSDASKTYTAEASFYCSWSKPGYCDAENKPAQIDKSFTFTVVAATTACTDTDGGKVYYTKGTVTLKGLSESDYCSTQVANTLVEMSCLDSNTKEVSNYVCPNGCENGACKPAVLVISPNGGGLINLGQNMNIVWESSGILQSDKINIWLEDYTDPSNINSSMVVVNLAGNLGEYNWVIPYGVKVGEKYKIKIETFRNNSFLGSDESNDYFRIVSASCIPTWQCGAWSVCTNNQQTRTCTDSNSCNNTTTKPSESQLCSNTTSCTDTDGGKNYYTKGTVVDKYGTYTDLCYAATNQVFEYYCDATLGYSQGVYYTCPNGCENGACKWTTTSSIQPFITVTSPNGGEAWRVGETHDITWTSSGIDNVAIGIFSYDSAGTRTNPGTIYGGAPAAGGKYSWTIPSDYATFVNKERVKIYLLGYGTNVPISTSTIYDFSNNYFSIAAATVGVNAAGDQLASISDALAKIVQEIQEMLKK